MIHVGINGYGTIGKRVAAAVDAQPDMAVVGVSKRSLDHEAAAAVDRGFEMYTPEIANDESGGGCDIPVAGSTEALIAESDVVVDATPAGVGAANASKYMTTDTAVVFQGGEESTVAPASFCARTNYEETVGEGSTRVVSCNTTGLARLLSPLEEQFGVKSVDCTLIRRGGDPTQSDRGPINDILPDPVTVPSHHAADLQTVLPSIDVMTKGVTVPATLMHLHSLTVRLECAPSAEAIHTCLSDERRVELVTSDCGQDSCADIRESAHDRGRQRGDVWENCVWSESISIDGRSLSLLQAIHQQADVIPENVDAIRALAAAADAETSRKLTNDALGVGLTSSLS
jgi:glyceraldehyde-3-phosphate dehydrogenase (NAD(P))